MLKWRHQSDRENEIPITVHCWPSVLALLFVSYVLLMFVPSQVSGDGSVIANVDYEAAPGVEAVDFSVTIPIVYAAKFICTQYLC